MFGIFEESFEYPVKDPGISDIIAGQLAMPLLFIGLLCAIFILGCFVNIDR